MTDFREEVMESLGSIHAKLENLSAEYQENRAEHKEIYAKIEGLGTRLTRIEVWAVALGAVGGFVLTAIKGYLFGDKQ